MSDMLSRLQTSFDVQEIIKRAIKYLIEGGSVAFVAYAIPKSKLSVEEIVIIALVAACVFAILDMFAPSIGNAARQGAGFGIGANLVGFPK
jgi:hypothetical protein|tara:strand:+ start:996 stop:1268 length:273 start_codon:yes stop_codon:yes gene_type:complete